MRMLVSKPEEAARLGRLAQAHVSEYHSIAARSVLYGSLIEEAAYRDWSVSLRIDEMLREESFFEVAERWTRERLRPVIRRLRRAR